MGSSYVSLGWVCGRCKKETGVWPVLFETSGFDTGCTDNNENC